MIDPRHQGLGQDILAPNAITLPAFRTLSDSIKTHSPHPPLAILQLNHPGRQSPRCTFRPPWVPSVAPSAVAMDSGEENWVARVAYGVGFGVPREMQEEEVSGVVGAMARAAGWAEEAGWDGVQVHCAHGCEGFLFHSRRTR